MIARASLHPHLPRCRYCQRADRHRDRKTRKMRKDGGNKVERASTVVESGASVDVARVYPHGRRKRGRKDMMTLRPPARGDDENGSNMDRGYDLVKGARRRRQRSPSYVARAVRAYRAPFLRPPRIQCGGRHDPSRELLESPLQPPSRRRYARAFRALASFRQLVAGDGAARAHPRGG
jgi:hypothetical protein